MLIKELKAVGVDLPPAFEDQYRERLLLTFDKRLQPIPGVEAVLHNLART